MSGINSIDPAGLNGQTPVQMLMAQQAKLNGPIPKDIDKIKELAKDFEGVLVSKMMDEMQKTIPDSGIFTDGATKQMKGLFWMFLSKSVADNGGIGLAKQLTRDFTRMANLTEPEVGPKTECLK